MASLGEGLNIKETKYESESEESVCLVAKPRENASDDDDDYSNGEGEAIERLLRSDRRFRAGYRYESEGLGGYDDDDAVSCFDDELQVLEDEQVKVFKEEGDEEGEENFGGNSFEERRTKKEVQAGVKHWQKEESKAPLDPRNGAFYMHDDRFRGSGRGPSRWALDESFRAQRDERKWMHDKFEEMKVQETYDNKFNAFAEVRKISEQYHRGHPKNQGKGQGYVKANWSKTCDSINNQNYSANVVRGRGPINYKPIMRSSNLNLPTKAKQSMRAQGQTSNIGSRRIFSTKDIQYSKPIEMPLSPESARTFSTKKTSKKFEKDASNTASPSIAWFTNQLLPITNQVSSAYPLAQQPIVQLIPIESTVQHPSLIFTRHLNQSSGSGVLASSEVSLPNYYKPGTLGSLSTSSKSKVAFGGEGISSLHGNGKGSLLSAETQTMGHTSQYNGDLGDPAVNRAVSSYLSQSQNAFGNPDITWFPVFPAADGTVGSACHTHLVPSKGGHTAHSTAMPSSHCVTRYSRMNFNKQSE